ncbi:MAG: GlsB/YeaQ/YmgE family stress response membrane protein [Phormidesmis sp.]
MNITAWSVWGLIAGAIARAIYPGHQGGGILGTMLLGIVGAFIGGAIYSLIATGSIAFGGASLSIGGVIVAVLGAILTLFIYYAATKRAA